MKTPADQSTSQRIEVARTIVASLAQRPELRNGQMAVVIEQTPEEAAAYRAALGVLTTYLTTVVRVDAREPESLMQTGLSVRTVNCLESAGITTVEQILSMNPEQIARLKEIKNAGERILVDVTMFIEKRTGRKILTPDQFELATL